MVAVNAASYDEFKNVFSGLGGSRKTIVLFVDDTNVNQFSADAVFGSDEIVVRFNTSTKPGTFDADFPQAVSVSGSINVS